VAAIIFLLILSPATQTPTVQAAVIYVQLKQALPSPDPVGPKTVNKVVTILHTATSNQLSINPVLVNVAAKRFIEGARQNPGAWRGVLALLDYRSSLNKEISSFPTAKCLPLGGAVLSNVKVSNSRFSNCNQVLDNIDWESNLFENVTVIYHGGLTVLENVQFKNCEFSLDNNPRGQLLAQSLWASNRVSIKLLDN
jgi:hypothetical protein